MAHICTCIERACASLYTQYPAWGLEAHTHTYPNVLRIGAGRPSRRPVLRWSRVCQRIRAAQTHADPNKHKREAKPMLTRGGLEGLFSSKTTWLCLHQASRPKGTTAHPMPPTHEMPGARLLGHLHVTSHAELAAVLRPKKFRQLQSACSDLSRSRSKGELLTK